MKKLLSLLVLALVAVQIAVAGDVITQDPNQLPPAARTFLKQYFGESQISHIKIETEFLNKKYEVLMTDLVEVEFDSKGNWTDVKCKRSRVPDELIPAYAKEYVQKNFPQATVVKLERDRGELEVDLNNGLSLTFNKRGQLIDIDD